MLTVWTMWTGDAYDLYYVRRLRGEVKRYLQQPHKFVCITDKDIRVPFGYTMKPPTTYPGWWGKIGLFKEGVAADRNLWLDLDVIITGSLDELVDKYCHTCLSMPLNWAQSGHGGCQSSVMAWADNHNVRQIYDLFDPKDARWPPVNDGYLWGDQEWITQLRDTRKIQVNPMNADWVKSYKYHVRGRGGPPEGSKVIVFHGSPKPSEVREPWFNW